LEKRIGNSLRQATVSLSDCAQNLNHELKRFVELLTLGNKIRQATKINLCYASLAHVSMKTQTNKRIKMDVG
jgi:hypothetical protein